METAQYKGIQGDTEVFRGIQRDTEGYRGKQRDTEGYRGYRGIQYTNDMLTQHISGVHEVTTV